MYHSLITLAEYLEDYSSDKTKEAGYRLIAKELEKMPGSVQKEKIIANLEAVKKRYKRFKILICLHKRTTTLSKGNLSH